MSSERHVIAGGAATSRSSRDRPRAPYRQTQPGANTPKAPCVGTIRARRPRKRKTWKVDERPSPRYTQAPDGVSLAYHITGEGPLDIGWMSRAGFHPGNEQRMRAEHHDPEAPQSVGGSADNGSQEPAVRRPRRRWDAQRGLHRRAAQDGLQSDVAWWESGEDDACTGPGSAGGSSTRTRVPSDAVLVSVTVPWWASTSA